MISLIFLTISALALITAAHLARQQSRLSVVKVRRSAI